MKNSQNFSYKDIPLITHVVSRQEQYCVSSSTSILVQVNSVLTITRYVMLKGQYHVPVPAFISFFLYILQIDMTLHAHQEHTGLMFIHLNTNSL